MLSKSNIEYVQYGINWMRGCAHNCAYCYMAAMAHRFNNLAPEGGDWSKSDARVEDPAGQLYREINAMRAMPAGPLMLCTSHDPAQSEAVAMQTRDVVQVLIDRDLADRTLLLTKAPDLALSVLGSVGAFAGLRFGASITTMGLWATNTYEPGAETPVTRMQALIAAQEMGYATWVSAEPPLPEVYLHKLMRNLIDLPASPWIVMGKLNYRGGGDDGLARDLRDWSNSDHWAWDRDEAVGLLESAGYVESLEPRDGGYWVKRELREC